MQIFLSELGNQIVALQHTSHFAICNLENG